MRSALTSSTSIACSRRRSCTRSSKAFALPRMSTPRSASSIVSVALWSRSLEKEYQPKPQIYADKRGSASICVNLRRNSAYRAVVKQMVLECEAVEVLIMEEGRDPVREVAEAVCDGLRQIGDFSYAIMPKDMAHALGDLKKSVLSQIRCLVDWETKWIDERVAGGDRLRQEWQQKCRQA